MYSLGVSSVSLLTYIHNCFKVVFFEMNFRFNTGAERIDVLEDLRKPAIIFPPTWDVQRPRQKDSVSQSKWALV